MKKTLTSEEIIETLKKLHDQNKKIVLAGGCFDVLHSGHIKYLRESKKQGDTLIILLESDENIKKLKGNNRPINNVIDRSIVLSSLSFVDYIILLRGMTNKQEYDKLIVQIKPACITLTVGDKNLDQRKNQCRLVDAKLVEIDKLNGISSSSYIKNI